MPERPNTIKVDASSIQGEGAYILWRRMTWGERKQVQQEAKDDKLDSIQLIVNHLAGWNWRDADGNDFPLPKTEADFEQMYDEEITFLASVARKAIDGRLEFTPEVEKN
ncbi:MAG: hypothetical protein WC657_08220 [Candidatus Paceibacterota bacterium]|jgi:hypothetical protein